MNRNLSGRAAAALLATWRTLFAALLAFSVAVPPVVEAREAIHATLSAATPATTPKAPEPSLGSAGAATPGAPSIGRTGHFYFPGGGAAAPVTYVGPSSNNTMVAVGATTVSSGGAQTLIHQTRVSGGITDMRLGLLRVTGSNSVTTALASSYTVNEISVRLASGGTVAKITKGGSTTWTVTPWNGSSSDPMVDWTDLTPLGFTIPANTDFYIFESYSGTNLPTVTNSAAQVIANDERLQTTGTIPTTMPVTSSAAPVTGLTQSDANRRTRLAAIGVIESTRTGDSLVLHGDSLVAFTSSTIPTADGSFADHNRGPLGNMLGSSVVGTGFDYVNLGIGGDQWDTRLTDMQLQQELGSHATTWLLELGINSFLNKGGTCGSTAATCAPIVMLQRYLPRLNGKKVVLVNLTPMSLPAWTNIDGSDQTSTTFANGSTFGTHGPNYNTLLTTQFGGLPVLDLRSAFNLDGSAGTGTTNGAKLWYANGTPQWSTQDTTSGVHMKQQAVLRATTNNGAAAQSLVAAASVMTGKTQPDAAPLTGLTCCSGSPARATTGTGTNNTVIPATGKISVGLKLWMPPATAGTHTFFPSTTSNFCIKSASVDTTTGIMTIRGAGWTSGTTNQLTTTTPLTANAPNTLLFTCNGTNFFVFINGTFEGSTTTGQSNACCNSNFSVAASSALGVGVSDVQVWNRPLYTSGTYTPITPTGTEEGLVAYWALSSNLNAIFGPTVPQ